MIDKLHELDIFTFDKILAKNNNSTTLQNKSVDKNYKIINEYSKLNSLVKKINNQEVVSIDLETTDINPNIANIVGIAISYKKFPISFSEKTLLY